MPVALIIGGTGQISRAVAAAYGVELDLVPLDGPPHGGVGASPWGIPSPVVLDMTRAGETGCQPVATYASAVGDACRSAEALAGAGVRFPAYIEALFDYAAEDAALG